MNVWDDEPNFREFLAGPDNYPVYIVRHARLLHLCGYVGVPCGHKAFKKGHDDIDLDCQPHGDLTFSDFFGLKNKTIPAPLLRKFIDYWFLGFDCAHWGAPFDDYSPGLNILGNPEDYKTMDYVSAECNKLAAELYMLNEKPEPLRSV